MKQVACFLRCRGVVITALLLSLASQVNAASVEDFARFPAFSNPQISPDGDRIAATIVHNGKPLVITRDEIDMIAEALKGALHEVLVVVSALKGTTSG